MRKRFLFILLFMLTASCTTQNQSVSNVSKSSNEVKSTDSAESKSLWAVRCSTDAVSGVKRCFAGTFGKDMTSSGNPHGRNKIPFQVIYINDLGPILSVGYNTYPGMSPQIRIDNGEPYDVSETGYTRESKTIIEAIKSGNILRAKYYVWPTGVEYMYVDLYGAREAIEKLESMVITE